MPDEDAVYMYKSIRNDHAAVPMFWNCLPDDAEGISRYCCTFMGLERYSHFPAYFGIYIPNVATPIGYLGLGECSKNDRGRSIFNLEYYLLPEHRRHGYAKEACKAAIDALREKKIHGADESERYDVYSIRPFDPVLIVASCDVENEGSRRVLEGLGFTYEGIGYEHYFRYDGEPRQMHRYHLVFENY